VIATALQAAGTHHDTGDLDEQLFAIWRATIHALFRTHEEYDCDRWCWMTQPREQQLVRFRGRLSFERFRQLLLDAFEIHCDRVATPTTPMT
jgi:hypothetical protein